MTQKHDSRSNADLELEQLMQESNETSAHQTIATFDDDDIDWEKELLTKADDEPVERAEDDADVAELQKDIDPDQTTETLQDEDEFGYSDDDVLHELLETDETQEQNGPEAGVDKSESELDAEVTPSMDDPETEDHDQQGETDELEVEDDDFEEEISLKEKIQGHIEAAIDKVKANPAQGIVYGITGLLCVFFLYQSIGFIQGVIGVTQNPDMASQEDYLANLDRITPTSDSQSAQPESSDRVELGNTQSNQPESTAEVIPLATVNPPSVKAFNDSKSADVPVPTLSAKAPSRSPQISEADIQAEIERQVALRTASAQVQQQPVNSGQSISDREMIDKNVQVILKMGARMQGYEQLMNSMQETLNDIKKEQQLIRQQLEKNNQAITQQQKSQEELADALVQIRRNGSAGVAQDTYVSRRPSAQPPLQPKQPTYEVIAASPESVIIRSERTGEPVAIRVGSNLIGYGKVTAINGFGQILTVSVPVQTK